MLTGKTIGFIGGGQMAEAIFSGILKAQAVPPANIQITDISAGRLAAMRKQYGVEAVQNDAGGAGARTLAEHCDVLVLAVKPQYARTVLEGVAPAVRPETTVVSIMGGVTLDFLEEFLPESPVLRVMPNTPMLVGKGVAGIARGARAGADDLALCRALFDLVGLSVVVEERLIDPLTSVSGCGPAFAYLFIEALADGGVEQGLPRDMAQALAAQMLAGAAEMVLQTGRHPGQLKDSVCSPGGGTIAGVHALEDGAFRATVMDAVARSRAKMEELGHKA